jgi:hypothetical protein
MCVLKLKKSISYCEKVPKKNRSPETFHSIWVFHCTVAAHALQAVIGLSVVPRETWILVGGSLTPVTLPVSVPTARYIGELNPLALSQAILQDVNFPSAKTIRH